MGTQRFWLSVCTWIGSAPHVTAAGSLLRSSSTQLALPPSRQTIPSAPFNLNWGSFSCYSSVKNVAGVHCMGAVAPVCVSLWSPLGLQQPRLQPLPNRSPRRAQGHPERGRVCAELLGNERLPVLAGAQPARMRLEHGQKGQARWREKSVRTVWCTLLCGKPRMPACPCASFLSFKAKVRAQMPPRFLPVAMTTVHV